jgi:hypothetical protein
MPLKPDAAVMSWPRALAAWLMIVVAESIHGTLRQLLLAPVVGDLPARQVGVLVGSLIVYVIAWLSIRWIGARTFAEQFRVGLAWVVLIAAFEFGLGAVLGYTRERMLADYDLGQGGYMGFGLLFLLFAPGLAAIARDSADRVRGKGYWFAAKRYGWGWGLPVAWQGWAFLCAWLIVVVLGASYLGPYGTAIFLAFMAVMAAVLVLVCYRKGEPPRWRWG